MALFVICVPTIRSLMEIPPTASRALRVSFRMDPNVSRVRLVPSPIQKTLTWLNVLLVQPENILPEELLVSLALLDLSPTRQMPLA